MTTPLTLYTHPQSRGRLARWMLEECGAAYDTVVLDYGTSMKAPAYTALNPMGKVPAIRHGDVVVTENAAICAYLADRFAAAQLAPAPDSPERGSYYRWLFFAAGPMEAATTAKAFGLLVPPERRSAAGYGTYEDVMATCEHAVRAALARGGHLCGAFSAADLYLAGFLNYGMQFGTIDKRAVFEDYAGPILQRPARARAEALDDALLAQRAAAQT